MTSLRRGWIWSVVKSTVANISIMFHVNLPRRQTSRDTGHTTHTTRDAREKLSGASRQTRHKEREPVQPTTRGENVNLISRTGDCFSGVPRSEFGTGLPTIVG